ncbi:stress response protein CsbD [Oceanobacillus picturae]|uniref:Stress response protein CsbD n=2 Tax=Oceanobacillus picturae TaxID=171693 RepID=A0A0U9HBF9_9BACI|nr:stress response protein CsbD [Oceanobacillus picturae]
MVGVVHLSSVTEICSVRSVVNMSKNGASDKVKGAISKAKGEFQDTAGEAKQNSNNRYER